MALSSEKLQRLMEKIPRSGYFLGALLFHLILFLMVATWVIFPAFHPPTDDFSKTFVPPSQPPPPPPQPQQTVTVPTAVAAPVPTTITAPSATPSFSVPMPEPIEPTTAVDMKHDMTQQVISKPATISPDRLSKISATLAKWGRSKDDVLESNGDPKNITAKFPVYLASYADGDWNCNIFMQGGKITAGSLPNLVAKMNEWSKGHITGEVEPIPLSLGSPDLLAKAPPFVFFTGHKDFKLTDQEIQNLRDYLQVGGCIWGDNALAGRGSRFDVAFRREMKRVVPDLDKNFEPVGMDHKIFTKSWYPLTQVPQGMNYYAEPLEHLDIDGKLAILYTPNDYSDMYYMLILPGDTQMGPTQPPKNAKSPLFTSLQFYGNSRLFFRNFTLPSCLACQKLGMNIIGYMLVRFDDAMLLSP